MAATTRVTPQGANPELVITRVFDAPRERVFQAWADPDRVAQWWGPKGFGVHIARLELRPGGTFLYSMALPSGQEIWGKFVYQEIVPPERLVFLSSFTDKSGTIVRSPFGADWPLQVFNTVTLTETEGRTTLTLQARPHEASEAERKAFEAAHGSMQQGFAGTFDQLADYLARG